MSNKKTGEKRKTTKKLPKQEVSEIVVEQTEVEQTEVEQTEVEQTDPEKASEPVLQDAPKLEPKKEYKAPDMITLFDAANRFVDGYKSNWWPSIRSFGLTQGITDLPVSVDSAKAVLKRWGANLK